MVLGTSRSEASLLQDSVDTLKRVSRAKKESWEQPGNAYGDNKEKPDTHRRKVVLQKLQAITQPSIPNEEPGSNDSSMTHRSLPVINIEMFKQSQEMFQKKLIDRLKPYLNAKRINKIKQRAGIPITVTD